jgi:predicted acetyltransferase
LDIEIRPITPEEYGDFAVAAESAFGHQPRPEELELWRKVFEFERSLAAFEAGTIVATAGAESLHVTVPGGKLPMAGVTAVTVRPTHRRRGLLTMLMRRQLDDVRDTGEPLAGLWASEGAIYQRFGYGLSTLVGRFEIDRQRTAFARPVQWEGSVRQIHKDEAMALFPSVHERVVERYPGMFDRTKAHWEHDFADLEHDRDGASPLFFAVYESTQGIEGYVAYRVKMDWPEGIPSNTVHVRELMHTTSQSYAALWRFCFDMDLVGTIESWGRPAEEPLLHVLAHPRALRFRIGDALWLRLVDLPAALAQRRYATEGSVTFEVRDSFCPWNEGRFELDGGPQGGQCRPTKKDPGLIADAADLAAAYLGGTRFRTLQRASRLVEIEPGTLERADAMFTWDPPPWCPQVF